ncbi:MAG: hypothetical protein ACI88G_002009 [Woeseiaceae bacterium]|jgi:hypothetical protein
MAARRTVRSPGCRWLILFSGWYFLGVLDSMKETRDRYFATSEMEKVEFDRVWESCISGRPVRQHLAIVEAWMNENPGRWQEPAIKLIFQAERDSCDELNDS